MRADRLVATLLLLQSRGRATAREIAAELEISVPTARRDLEALSAAGVPVYPQPGRGGGWSLVGGARTDLTGLTADETRALFLLLGPATSADADGPARSALRKVLQALPRTFRSDAESAAGATTVDAAPWGARAADAPDQLAAVRRAVLDRVRLRAVYENHAGERSERTVDPWGLVDKDGVWYLLAGTARGRRVLRVDRLVSVRPTAEPVQRPADLDLAREWEEVAAEVEGRRSQTWATLRVDARHVPVLEAQFGRHLRELGGADDGRVRVRVADPTPLDLARHLAGWGGLLYVEEPVEVRDELARIGRELVAAYPPAEGVGATT